jgi:hypothetical protein
MTAPLPCSGNKCRLGGRIFPRWFGIPINAARSILDEQPEKKNRQLQEVLGDATKGLGSVM